MEHTPPRGKQEGVLRPGCQGREEREILRLGYKLYVSVDHKRILSLAGVLAPANENEKRHGPTLVERTKQVLKKAGARLRSLITDSQYSSGR